MLKLDPTRKKIEWFATKKGVDVVDKSPPKFDLVYSRGGTGSSQEMDDEKMLVCLEEKAQLMQTTAISFASSQGIHLRPGVSTNGRGDCIFEACIDQFLRPEFENLTENELEPHYWRNKVVDLVENNLTAYQLYRMVKSKGSGSKKQQWTNDWVKLRQPGQFQCQAGDFLILGLATILHKNILVFNTHRDAPKPITVHLASTLGGSTTTDIPILLCYNKEHYEGLLPVSIEDQKNTIKLLEQYSPKSKRSTIGLICPIPGKTLFSSGSMPQNTQTTSSHPTRLHLKNYGENLCFSNAVVQLLALTEIKPFLLSELPAQPDAASTTAQELARIYSSQNEEETTANLRRQVIGFSNVIISIFKILKNLIFML